MMSWRALRRMALVVGLLAALFPQPPQAAWGQATPAGEQGPPAASQETIPESGPVQVKWGAAWRKATIVKREDDIYLVKYEGLEDDRFAEWVTAERVRPIGSTRDIPPATPTPRGQKPQRNSTGAAATPAPGAAPEVAPGTAPERIPDRGPVEVKWGGSWRKAAIIRREGDIYLVRYDGYSSDVSDEWVTAERVRPIGSTRDIPYARPTPRGQKPQRSTPGAAVSAGARPAMPAPKAPPPASPASPGVAASGGSGGDNPAPAAPAHPEAEADPSFVKADWSVVQRLTPDAATWAYKPPQKPLRLEPRPITLATAASMRDVSYIRDIVFTARRAVVRYAPQDVPTADKPQECRLERLDLVGGGSIGTAAFTSAGRLLAASPDGLRVAMGHKGYLEFWNITAASGKKLVTFVPASSGMGESGRLRWAALLDHERLLTFTGLELTHWKLPEVQAVWSMTVNDLPPVLLPGGEHLLISSNGYLCVVHAGTGESAGFLDEPVSAKTMAVSSDGRRAATAAPNQLTVWDLEQARQIAEVPLPVSGTMGWLDNRFLLVAGRWVVDSQSGQVVWQYIPDGVQPQMFAGRLWLVTRAIGPSPKPVLAAVTLPHEEVLTAAARTDLPPLTLLARGSQVSLEVHLDGEAREQVTKALTEKLAANGMSVADGQPLRLVANVPHGETRQVTYDFGFGRQRHQETVSFTSLRPTLTFFMDGKSIWQTSTTVGGHAPMALWLREGETASEAAAKQTANPWQFFLGVKLPQTILRPIEPGTVGQSRLTAKGVEKGQ